jgi:hypothetical protein
MATRILDIFDFPISVVDRQIWSDYRGRPEAFKLDA